MAGHNKWSKVKHIKARVDAIKGKVFSKCAHEIAITGRDGGGDPTLNHRLRAAIDSAKAVSMPKDNIERAIKKGTGELGGEVIQEVSDTDTMNVFTNFEVADEVRVLLEA